jgi:hypothetical protein
VLGQLVESFEGAEVVAGAAEQLQDVRVVVGVVAVGESDKVLESIL